MCCMCTHFSSHSRAKNLFKEFQYDFHEYFPGIARKKCEILHNIVFYVANAPETEYSVYNGFKFPHRQLVDHRYYTSFDLLRFMAPQSVSIIVYYLAIVM